MKDNFTNITRMENTMIRQENTIRDLEEILKKLDGLQADYEALTAYYYSEQRARDLEEKNLIPDEPRRGVLSEDELYNLFLDTHDTALHMLETAVKLLTTN